MPTDVNIVRAVLADWIESADQNEYSALIWQSHTSLSDLMGPLMALCGTTKWARGEVFDKPQCSVCERELFCLTLIINCPIIPWQKTAHLWNNKQIIKNVPNPILIAP